MKKYRKSILMTGLLIVALIVSAVTAATGINDYVKRSATHRIITEAEASQLADIDCIIVLGCGVRDDDTPSAMLADRLKVGISLYQKGFSPKLLMSGDHGRVDYDEVNVMKQYAIDRGVPSEDIVMDHAGFSTYESVYRAKEIFKADKIIIISQEYHLYRAVYIAQSFGLEAYGVSADLQTYSGQSFREVREVLARSKDFLTSIFKPKPTFLGDTIPVSGNGDVTNDK